MGRFFDLRHSPFDRYDPDDFEPDEPDFKPDTYDEEDYENAYDEEGDWVECDNPVCDGYIKWKDGHYICPECGSVMSRRDFFNSIGARPPGRECITCNESYPKCYICPNGYVSVL